MDSVYCSVVLGDVPKERRVRGRVVLRREREGNGTGEEVLGSSEGSTNWRGEGEKE